MLCITTEETYYSVDTDGLEDDSPNRARLCIYSVDGAKQIIPLLSNDFTINDIKTKTVYLDKNTIKPGCIYKEKSGTEYLYLGDVDFDSCDIRVFKELASERGEVYKYTRSNYNVRYMCHSYIRMTKAIRKIHNESPNMIEFLKRYAEEEIYDRGKRDLSSMSARCTPRKFVSCVNDKFANYIDTLPDKRNDIFQKDDLDIWLDVK